MLSEHGLTPPQIVETVTRVLSKRSALKVAARVGS
jgi:hypothetical protein